MITKLPFKKTGTLKPGYRIYGDIIQVKKRFGDIERWDVAERKEGGCWLVKDCPHQLKRIKYNRGIGSSELSELLEISKAYVDSLCCGRAVITDEIQAKLDKLEEGIGGE
jgi:ribosome-binding protein aMBF1 (putative translation factor)